MNNNPLFYIPLVLTMEFLYDRTINRRVFFKCNEAEEQKKRKNLSQKKFLCG